MNLTGVLKFFEDLPAYNNLQDRLADEIGVAPLKLPPAARAPLLAKLFASGQRTILFVTSRVDAAPVWQQALEAWLPEENHPLRFLEPTPLPFERGPWSRLSRTGRLTAFAKLLEYQHPLLPKHNRPLLVVTSARALLQKTIPRRRFAAATRLLRVGQVIDLDKLINDWLVAGYAHKIVVESEGHYSRRGGILDIFPVGSLHPIRIELFGDEIETLRAFDPATQRSGDAFSTKYDHLIIPPARELMPGDAIELGRLLAEEASEKEDNLPSWREDLVDIEAGEGTPNLEYYLPMVYSQPGSIVDFLPENALVVIDDLVELEAAIREIHIHATQVASEQVDFPPGFPHPLFQWKELIEKFSGRQSLVLGQGDAIQTTMTPAPNLALSFQPGPRYGGQMRPFIMQLREAANRQESVIIVSRQAQRLAELWQEDMGDDLALEVDQEGGAVDSATLYRKGQISFVQGTLTGGFIIERGVDEDTIYPGREPEVLLHLLTDAEIFGWSRPAPRRRSRPRPVAPETYFADIAPGNYVVHSEFGIGKFVGLVSRMIGGSEREYLQVTFANSDVLYVPVHHADRLSKWIGPDDRSPNLQRLGEKSWRTTKAKAQQSVDELADELLELYAVREMIAGHAFDADSQWQAELEASFPYRETEDQIQAISEVKNDMERAYPMDRLICGDVGYGKTEVALRAAFKAVMDGKQVAILVPTTVLAQQHYNTFRQRLKPFPVILEMLSRFRTAARQGKILQRLRDGQIDIVIGTHRLLSADVSFKDLGLLIIDEEQRFGVAHKERLKRLRTEVDVLTMTATPIPRTLYLSLTGARDISQIDTAPIDRLPIQNYTGEFDEILVRRAILRELDRGGQTFYVHNRVQTIGNALVKLTHLVPDAVIAVGHGQMGERELEDVMLRFVNGEVDVLLTTTIIESGLDIPNANTIIVDRADRFGLAQLYQLRGRVGRGVRRAYAYLLHPPWDKLTNDAKVRLEVIGAQSELGAGYTIAMRDLEIRGAGDLLGSRQSGHIASVGFALYTRMLAQAVRHRKATIKGEIVKSELSDDVLIDIPLAAYIPTDYVSDSSLRLRLYRRMAILDTMTEIDEMAGELADRFGAIPDPIDNLLYQLRIKTMAIEAAVASVTSEAGQIQIRLTGDNGQGLYQLQMRLGPDVRVSKRGIWLGRGMSTREWQVTLVQTLEKLQESRRDKLSTLNNSRG